jgi:hypothetical protein
MRSRWAKLLVAWPLLVMAASFAYSQNAYRDAHNGVSLSLPLGWTWTDPQPSSEQKSIVVFREARTRLEAKLYVQVLQPPEQITPAEKMNRRLLKQARSKVEQRIREGFQDYRLREESCELKVINGRSALSWVSEYTASGQSMAEYLTRVRSESTSALFYVKLPAEHLDDFKRRLDPIIETLQIR